MSLIQWQWPLGGAYQLLYVTNSPEGKGQEAVLVERPGKRRSDTPLAACAAWAGDDKLPAREAP